MRFLSFFIASCSLAWAQEAGAGIDLRATVTAQLMYTDDLSGAPRFGSEWAPGFRAVFYPTIKFNESWSLAGAVQTVSRPYYPDDETSVGHGVRNRVLLAALSWTRVWAKGSVAVRAGQLQSAFGSFLLRYDDADNPLPTMAPTYGYYHPVTYLGLAGTEVNVTAGRWDGRVQLTSSSPSNPRSIFDRDQYPNWTAGVGYTIRQGLRIGASGYRGPYLDRSYPYFFPGESKPRDLPATAVGVDGEWARGHWNIRAEWQHFAMTYHAIPTFRQAASYIEVKRVLTPRWFVAGRAGYLHNSISSGADTYEGGAGYHLNTFQTLKAGYRLNSMEPDGRLDGIFLVQLVSSLHPFSQTWR